MDGNANDNNDDSGSSNDNNQNNDQKQVSDSVDLSKVTAEDFTKLLDREDIKKALLSSEPVRREIQSQKDKEFSRESRKRFDDDRTRVNAETVRLDNEEKARMIADGDAEALLKRESAKLEKEKLDSDASSRVGRVIEDTLRVSPEFESLGEDRIQEIYSETSKSGGNVVDFTTALSREKTNQSVKSATEAALKDIDERVQVAVEAKLAEAGVKVRSEDAKDGKGPSADISDGTVNRANIKLDDKKDISKAYGDGTISTKEFKARMKKFEEEY